MATTSTTTRTVAAPPSLRLSNRSERQQILELVSIHEVQQSRSSLENRPNAIVSTRVEVDRPLQSPEFDPTLAAHPTVPWPVTNPEWWERGYRRVPDYRPVNYELDMSERAQPVALRIGGYLVIGGCQIMSHADALWRLTMGRLTNAKEWRIGGEW